MVYLRPVFSLRHTIFAKNFDNLKYFYYDSINDKVWRIGNDPFIDECFPATSETRTLFYDFRLPFATDI